MIKRTIYFTKPAYLSLKNKQLAIKDNPATIPIEDIGIVVLDNVQITLTHQLIIALQKNNVVLISCDEKHMPSSYMLPYEGHSEQMEAQRAQLSASEPLKKNLWSQLIAQKIANQAAVMEIIGEMQTAKRLQILARKVQTGDHTNLEGHAAAIYWKHYQPGFERDRYGEPPNNYLNYGYAVLRAMVARALVGAGLLPTLGIQHRNKYNAFCFADDMMEPFRPFIDLIVLEIMETQDLESFLSQDDRITLLGVVTMDAKFGKKMRPLWVGMIETMASLRKCFKGEKRRMVLPQIT